MSAAPKIIEGTWDEVLAHAHELAGHRLRVTILQDAAASQSSPSATLPSDADAWVQSLYEWAQNRPPVPTVLDDSRETIYAERLDRQL